MSRDYNEEFDRGLRYQAGPNDGGIKRGDKEETGDNEARPTEGVGRGGSGEQGGNSGASGHVTGDASSLGGGPSDEDSGAAGGV